MEKGLVFSADVSFAVADPHLRRAAIQNMPNAELLTRFHNCLRYQQAKAWQKPLVSPRRFGECTAPTS